MATVIPKITCLSNRVIRILGCNPGMMTLQGTNTYIIGTGNKRVLLDTGESNKPEYIHLLKSVLTEQNCNLQTIIVSHWHLDHIGGVSDIITELKPDCAVWKLPRNDSSQQSKEENVKYLQNGDIIDTEGAKLKVIATPGHTDDHLILFLEEENAVFSGDCILGEGTAVFEDLYTYMKSLQVLLDLNPSVIYPGHGPVVEDPSKKIKEYIQHRLQREEQIVDCLKEAKSGGLTITDLVKNIYKDVPSHLHPAAAVNVSHHLSKLLKETVIRPSDYKKNTPDPKNHDTKYFLN